MPINLIEAFEAACTRHWDVAFANLSEVDRVLVSIWALEGDVNNGGFHQYYFNSSGDTAFHAPIALRLIGAHAAADIVEEANLRFGPDGPPASRDRRDDALSALSTDLWDDLDLRFYAYPDDIAALLERYLEANRVSDP
jgi:hypothetical protein